MRRSARSRTRSRGETRALARARAQIDQTTLTLRHNDFTPGEVNWNRMFIFINQKYNYKKVVENYSCPK